METRTIKKDYTRKKSLIIGIVLIILVLIYIVSKISIENKRTMNIKEEKIELKDTKNIIAMYISENGVDYNENTGRMPTDGYVINEEKSYCYIGSKSNKDNEAKLYTNNNGEHVISNLTKGDKCILYFDKTRTMEELLNNYYTDKRERKSENKDFNVPYEETTTKTIFSAPEGDGTSYYFAGNPSDNWVEFGGYYWRIIRINGDGTIRMIYQGTTKGTATGTGTQINGTTYKFNNSYNNNMYVGYWYQSGVLRGLQEPSNAYTELNNWFASSNIKQGTSYYNLIDPNVGFCGDRTPYTGNTPGSASGGGTGTTTTYYGAYLRLAPEGSAVTASTTKVEPTFNCGHNDDLYTYSGANQGNKKLANPVGMITADEVAYAGLVFATSPSARTNYLDTQQHYWTMSPCSFDGSYAHVFRVNSDGYLNYGGVGNSRGVRPVINLKSSVKLTGEGTQSNPYKVV